MNVFPTNVDFPLEKVAVQAPSCQRPALHIGQVYMVIYSLGTSFSYFSLCIFPKVSSELKAKSSAPVSVPNKLGDQCTSNIL